MTRKTPTETGEKIINDTKIGLATDTAEPGTHPTERPKADTTRIPQTRKQPAQEGTGKRQGRSSPARCTTPLVVRPATIVPLDAEQENAARRALSHLYSEFLASRNQR